ncbi:MAG: class I SAM-dependent methyltransferase [Thermoanaerobaculia bacterium]|nr:class I SAM-dependent methyltransferase [Thermoanaerobaculia bacterium]
MSSVQTRAERMIDTHGFLGVPRETFEVGGRAQLVRLLQNGLLPESKVLDIGCGVLRVGYWLVRFLDPGCYRGIEPARQRVELGRRYLFEDQELSAKQPRFDYNAEFDTSVFGERFDYFLAGSIWTHCSKSQIDVMLDGFERNSGVNGVFLTSYLPAVGYDDDYSGDTWVGTSHECDTPGVVYHRLGWIEDNCRQRGLRVTQLPGLDCDSQYWLRIDRG